MILCVIIPLRNEEEIIDFTVDEIFKWQKKIDFYSRIFFVDDHSTDKTFESVNARLKENGRAFLVRNNYNTGKGAALKAGFDEVSRHFPTQKEIIVAFLDGDLQIRPREIETLINIMNLYNADIVIGNKRHPYSNIKYTFARHVVSLTYNLIVRLLFGLKIRDTQCGIKLFRKEALDEIMPKIKTTKFAFDLELLVKMKAFNLRIADAPIKIFDQINAGSVNAKNIMETLSDTLNIFLRKTKGE
jgi:glycosyltransferase involved in cell wall biosynthesis